MRGEGPAAVLKVVGGSAARVAMERMGSKSRNKPEGLVGFFSLLLAGVAVAVHCGRGPAGGRLPKQRHI